jgi:hypothetical protein
MQAERKHKVLEPNDSCLNDSSEDEDILFATPELKTKRLETLKEMIALGVNDGFDNVIGLGQQT